MTIEEKKVLLADVLEMDVSDIDLDKQLSEISSWNSMSRLSLIVLFDDEFSKRLTGEQLRQFVTISDIIQSME